MSNRVAFFRERLAKYVAAEPLGYCSCCGSVNNCSYDSEVAEILSGQFGVSVPISYVQSAEYWRDQSLWESLPA